jgi:TolB-like protein/Tfp pilus assembly protein PilF
VEANRSVSVFTELRRRNVYRIAAAYVVAAWLIIQLVETIFPAFGFDEAATRLAVIVLTIGFVPAVVLAWVFEITPQGLRLDARGDSRIGPDPRASRRLDQVIIAFLVIAVAYFAFDKFIFTEPNEAAPEEAIAQVPIGGSIAVLPFVDMSPGGDQAYFSDGISEELLNLLSRIPELRVVSRSSSFAFKDKNTKARDIARELGVNYILEGSVRKDGDRVRITAQLIDALTDTHLWSGTFERELEDIFAIQDEIATSVIPALEIELLHKLPITTETDAEAYMLYLQGVHFYQQRTSQGLENAVDYLLRSIEIDSGYAPPWVTLASAYINQGHTGQRDYSDAYELATKAIDEALKLNPDLPFAHSARAWIAFNFERDYAKSARHFRIARTLFPNSDVILANSSALLTHLGRVDESLRLLSRSIALQPADSVAYEMRALRFMRLGRLEEAEADINKAIQLSPGSGSHYSNRALLRLLQGRPLEAIADTEKADHESLRLAILAMANNDLGFQEASDEAIGALLAGHADAYSYNIAMVFAWRGESAKAFEWLDRAISHGQSVYGIKTDPFLQGLTDDPRWDITLERLGLTDAQVVDILL